MAFSGGDLGLMANLASTLRTRGQDLHTLMGAIETPVQESSQYWMGTKNSNLLAAWNEAKPLMSRLVTELETYQSFTTTTAGNIDAAAN